MNQAEINPELKLEQLLAGMAKDVPPMPADFHDKWMNAVRAESKQTNLKSSNQANQAKPAVQPEEAPVSRWPKILSLAAVFVFLIGGTLIYRSIRKPILPENRSVNSAAVTETVEANDSSGSETTVSETATAGAAIKKAADGAGEAGSGMDAAGEADFAAENSAAEADAAAEAPVIGMAMESAGETAYEANAMEEAEEAYDGAMEKTEEAETRPVKKITAEAPAKEAAAEITPTEVPATETPVSASGVHEGIGGFFTDMGDFLLTVWPYLLAVLVLLAIAAAAIKSRKK